MIYDATLKKKICHRLEIYFSRIRNEILYIKSLSKMWKSTINLGSTDPFFTSRYVTISFGAMPTNLKSPCIILKKYTLVEKTPSYHLRNHPLLCSAKFERRTDVALSVQINFRPFVTLHSIPNHLHNKSTPE